MIAVFLNLFEQPRLGQYRFGEIVDVSRWEIMLPKWLPADWRPEKYFEFPTLGMDGVE